MAIIDGIIVGLGFIAFDTDTVMYSIIALMTITYIVNRMMSGTQSSRNVMIISQNQKKLKTILLKLLIAVLQNFQLSVALQGLTSAC